MVISCMESIVTDKNSCGRSYSKVTGPYTARTNREIDNNENMGASSRDVL